MLKYIDTNYFPQKVLEKDLPLLFSSEDICKETFEHITELYAKHDYTKLNENQLEEELLKPILNLLSYAYITQESINVHGKQLKPDYLLFATDRQKSEYINNKSLSNILSIFEAKAWGIPLDSKKISESPHMQLVQYNLFMGVPFGILSNGKEWRFYDLRDRKSEKIFFEINLEAIIQDKNYEAFRYFYYIFRKEYFVKTDNIVPIDETTKAKELFIQQMEQDLKEVIYGKNSIVEKVGQVLHSAYPDEDLKVLFEHSVVMAYRLLFIAYFETQFRSYLFDNHDHYKNVALLTLFDKLRNNANCKAYQDLTTLFDVLDKGSVPFKIPLLNGGLFDLSKAPLFEYKKNKNLFSNKDIEEILTELLKASEDSLGIRNFAAMSVTHIGNIYEGLLQYTFRIAVKKMHYVEYKDETLDSGYFDVWDYEKIAKKKNVMVLFNEEIPEGSLYLVNRSNSRKISASYYTPQTISRFMVSDAVKSLVESEKSTADILSTRIIDNACGSGHFLVDVLDELTEKVYANIEDSYVYLQEIIDIEKNKILDNLEEYSLEHIQIDELQILKRILLKKVIFGVDLEGFAVELTRLSLWLKTFIFGTPLSFIEHHIKQGNALIGSSISEGEAIFNEFETSKKDIASLFTKNFRSTFVELGQVAEQLANLPDSTSEEIKKSKELYYNEIEPKQKKLASILDLITYHKMRVACKKTKGVDAFSVDSINLLDNMETEIYNGGNPTAVAEISRVARQYSFFHYDIAFPEMYDRGFDIIIGNPPWDKVKFDEKDFFPQYRSRYRSMPASEKQKTRDSLLKDKTYAFVQQDYNQTSIHINTTLAYYKSHYPLNGGSGDTNLFRLFIEKNLGMLQQEGHLIYVTPSAWSYEEGSLQIRKHILDNLKFNYFYQFENREAIFHDIHRSYKFAVWSITNTPCFNETVPAFFMERDINRLYPEEGTEINQINYPLSLSRTHFPQSYIMLEIKNPQDIDIINKMYSVGKAIDPAYIDFRNELHMTNDNDLFLETEAKGLFPLYEGKMIHQFTPHFVPAQYWVDPQQLRNRLQPKEISRMIDNVYEQLMSAAKNTLNPTKQKLSKEQTVLNHLGLKTRTELAPFVVYDYTYPRLAFREIAANTNERTLIASLIPKNNTMNHKLWVVHVKNYILEDQKIIVKHTPIERILWVTALLNSIPFDYMMRFLVDTSVSKNYLMQLPLIHATEAQLATQPYATIWQNALAISAYNEPAFQPLALQHNVALPHSDKARDLLQIDNDKLIAMLYGITPEELSAILDTFPVLTKNRPEYVALLRG
ncbi:MAG: Eco57I restriction-modification methylase domain-containing protein [Brevinema sp.]